MEILNYINGKWIKPSVKEHFEFIDPATSQVIAQTPLCSAEDAAAAAALPVWSRRF